MTKPAIVSLAAAAFLLPIGIVAFHHRDALLKPPQPDFGRASCCFSPLPDEVPAVRPTRRSPSCVTKGSRFGPSTSVNVLARHSITTSAPYRASYWSRTGRWFAAAAAWIQSGAPPHVVAGVVVPLTNHSGCRRSHWGACSDPHNHTSIGYNVRILDIRSSLGGPGIRTSRLPILTLLAFTWPCCVASAAQLAAGPARIDVTPPSEFNAALGGYGERMSRPAEGVHDRVFAKALVLTDGSRRNVIVTADVLGFPPAFKPALDRSLHEQNWSSAEILLLPSHSHTSIEMNAINPKNIFGIKQIGVYDARLFKWLVERFAEVIRQACQAPVPVVVGTSAATLEGWNRNRRIERVSSTQR